jgi:hypothetical protein
MPVTKNTHPFFIAQAFGGIYLGIRYTAKWLHSGITGLRIIPHEDKAAGQGDILKGEN